MFQGAQVCRFILITSNFSWIFQSLGVSNIAIRMIIIMTLLALLQLSMPGIRQDISKSLIGEIPFGSSSMVVCIIL
jgi:hypothetical protein